LFFQWETSFFLFGRLPSPPGIYPKKVSIKSEPASFFLFRLALGW
jgi:hypothetical protein